MTVNSSTSKSLFNGDGSTTVFSCNWPILATSDILVQTKVVSTGIITTQTLTTNYTVSIVSSAFTVTMLVAPPSGTTLIVLRNVQELQQTTFAEYTTFPAKTVETSLDRLTMIAQQNTELLARTVAIDPAIIGFSPVLPIITTPGYLLGINNSGNGFALFTAAQLSVNYTISTGVGILAQGSSTSASPVTMTGTANEITVTYGNGLGGNPTYSLPSSMTFTGKTITGGTYSAPTLNSPVINSPSFTNVSFAGRNYIINGNMFFDQNHEGTAYTVSSSTENYTLDQWRAFGGTSGAGVMSITRIASSAVPGFINVLDCKVVTTQTDAADNNFHIEYPIESPHIVPWAWGTASAKTVTLSFWAAATNAGTYSVCIIEGTNSRSYVTTFTITSNNVFQYFTITIPGDTSGTYQTAEATFGVKIIWDCGLGSTNRTASSETWLAGQKLSKTGSASLITQANNSHLYLTGVQLEVGSTATPYEFIPVSQQLQLLQRYFWKTFPKGIAIGTAKGTFGSLTYACSVAGVAGAGIQVRFPIKMCSTSPVLTTYNPTSANSKWYNYSASADSGVGTTQICVSDDGFYLENPQVSGDGAGQFIGIHVTASAQLGGP